MLLFIPACFLFMSPSLAQSDVLAIVSQGVFQGLFTSVIALLCYTKAVNLLGPGRGSAFAALVPGIVLLLAIPILDEWPGTAELLGVIIITLGMLLTLGLFQRSETKAPATAT